MARADGGTPVGRLRELAVPLQDPSLRRLVVAFLVNELGDGITSIAFPLAVYAFTSSGTLTGLAFAAVRAAGLVGTPIGGVLADRVDRLAVLRWSFVVRALLLAVALVTRVDMVTLAVLLLVRIGGTVDNPAAEAAVREHAGDRPQAVATIRKVAAAVSLLVGPAVGGLLVTLAGIPVAVAGDLATFVVALVVLGRRGGGADAAPRVPPGSSPPTPMAERSVGLSSPTSAPAAGPASVSRATTGVVARAWRDAGDGVGHLRRQADLRLVTASTTVNALLVAALLTAAVVYLHDLPGAPGGAYGYAMAAYGAGSLLGLVLAGSASWRAPLSTIIWRAMLVYAVACLAGVVVADWRVLAASWAVWGLSYGPEEIVSDVVLVEHTPTALLGRTYAGVGMVAAAGQVAGAIIGGLLGDLVGPRVLIAGLAAAYLPAAVAAWWWGRRHRPSAR